MSQERTAPHPTGGGLGRVLVTGARGFIGTHLVKALLERGTPVRCLSRSHPAPAGAETAMADLADAEAVRDAMQDVEVLLHLGAVASVDAAAVAPAEVFRVNTVGTQNVLEAARLSGVRRAVLLSTAHVFGRPASLPVTEEHPPAPLSYYAATKLAADVIAMGYFRACGLPVTVLRPTNIYGPGQSAQAVIPTIVALAVSEHRIKVRDPWVWRDFVYVDDIVEAILLASAGSPACAGQHMLLASGHAVSVETIMRRVANITGAHIEGLSEQPKTQSDCFFASGGRAEAMLGWVPKVDLEEGLERTVAWWRAHENAVPAVERTR